MEEKGKITVIQIIDDRMEWHKKITPHIEKIMIEDKRGYSICHYNGNDKRAALHSIYHNQADIVLLDINITEDEEFDGLYIGRHLKKDNFKGMILLTNRDRENSALYREVIGIPQIHIPGKWTDKIEACLKGECECFEPSFGAKMKAVLSMRGL